MARTNFKTDPELGWSCALAGVGGGFVAAMLALAAASSAAPEELSGSAGFTAASVAAVVAAGTALTAWHVLRAKERDEAHADGWTPEDGWPWESAVRGGRMVEFLATMGWTAVASMGTVHLCGARNPVADAYGEHENLLLNELPGNAAVPLAKFEEALATFAGGYVRKAVSTLAAAHEPTLASEFRTSGSPGVPLPAALRPGPGGLASVLAGLGAAGGAH